MTDEDLINKRLLEVLQLLDSIPLSSPEEGVHILNEVTNMLRDPRLVDAAPGSDVIEQGRRFWAAEADLDALSLDP
jgi:hypothetical protein